MSCGGGTPKFRLLDALVGWDIARVWHLTGCAEQPDDEEREGLRLSQVVENAIAPAPVFAYLPPARLARGCGHCDWRLASGSQLWRRDCCHEHWLPLWRPACQPAYLQDALALAVHRQRLAV